MTRPFRLLLDPQGGEGGTPPPAEKPAPDLAKAVEGLLAKHGDAAGALRVLLAENHGYRDQLRELKGKLPPEGSMVLAGDDVKSWAGYRELGKPADLRKALDDGKAATAERDEFRRERFVGEVAGLHGYKPTVLATLSKGLDIEVAEEKGKDGKAVKVARVKGEGDQTTPLNEYAEAHWKDFLPALKADTQQQPPRGGTGAGATTRPAPAVTPPAGATNRPAGVRVPRF